MKLSKGNEYLKADNVKQGQIVQFTNAGEIEVSTQYRYKNQDGTEGDFVRSLVFRVKYEGEDKKLKISAASKSSLIEAFGDDTENWVGKKASIMVIPTPNGQKKMIVLVPITSKAQNAVKSPEEIEWSE